MTCRYCKNLRVRPDADGKIRIRKDYTYTCTFDAKTIPLPDSVRRALGYSWPPRFSHMSPDDGEGCVGFEKMLKRLTAPEIPTT